MASQLNFQTEILMTYTGAMPSPGAEFRLVMIYC